VSDFFNFFIVGVFFWFGGKGKRERESESVNVGCDLGLRIFLLWRGRLLIRS
jgi:hypothetical protein